MPFQSEKQRRYLWANEPEIARDWTDTYGSGIGKALGGRIPFALGSSDEIIETQSDIGNQIAYKPNSNKDKILKSLFEMKSTYGETPAYRQQLQKDWDNHIKTGEPLSLPKEEYSGVKGFTALNDPYADLEGLTADAGNVMSDTQYATVMDEILRDPSEIAEDLYDSNFRYVDQQIPGINEPKIPTDEVPPTSQRYNEYNQNRNMGTLEQGIGQAFATDDTDDDLKALSYAVEPPEQQSVLTNFLDRILPNRTKLTPADRRGNEAFLSNQMMSIPSEYRNVGIDNTGRMVGGLFAGKNAPGSSMFGSANVKEMAQKWAQKNQHRQYKTPKMQAKQEAIINIATGGRDPDQGNTVTGHGKSGMGRDRSELMARGGLLRRGYSTGGITRLLPGKYE